MPIRVEGMRKLLAFSVASLTLVLTLVVIGCSQGPTAAVPAPAVRTNSLPAAVVGATYSITLQATGGAAPYIWSVSGGALPAWAIFDPGTGIISGIPDAAAAWNFSVRVTDAAGRSSVDQALSLVVNAPPPSLALAISTASLPSGTVGIPYSVALQAYGGSAPYTWSVLSSLPSWSSLNPSTGVISGTPEAAGATTFTVEVVDSADPPASATREFTIETVAASSANNGKLSGRYAFLLQGYDDGTRERFAVVGSFLADSKGNITGGLEDINGPDGYKAAVSFTGTYSVGPDNRGFASFTNSLGQSTTFALAVGSLNAGQVAEKASLIEFDDMSGTSGKRGSGFVFMQDPNACNLASLTGPYAFQFVGQTQTTGSRLALTGAFIADGKGSVTNGQADANALGIMATEAFTAAISAGNATAPSGRVRFTSSGLSVPNFVFYIASADTVLAMSTDQESAAGLLAGRVLKQSSPLFSAASLNGTSVGYGVGSSVSAGLWTFDGISSASFNLIWSDANWIYPGGATGSLSYSVSANGRVTTTGASVAPGVPGKPVLYLVDTNEGFLMSTDASAAAGFFEPQTDGPFSSASLSGGYFLGTVAAAAFDSAVTSGVGTSSGDGTLTLTMDRSELTNLLSADQSESLSLPIGPSGTGQDNAEDLGSSFSTVYIVSHKKAVLLLNIVYNWPMVTILEQ